MNTLAVMCIELTSTRPSVTPLLRTASSTCGVMFTKAIFEGMLKVRCSVCDFMLVPLLPPDGPGPRSLLPRVQVRHEFHQRGRVHRLDHVAVEPGFLRLPPVVLRAPAGH